MKPKDISSSLAFDLSAQTIKESMTLACRWIGEIAQVKTDELPENTYDTLDYKLKSWKGAIRSQYYGAEKYWDFFGPIWHSGQALRALVLASATLNDTELLKPAKLICEFILNNQVWNPNDPAHGLILAVEDSSQWVNTSAVLECMLGLMLYADKINSSEVWERTIQAGRFLIENLYLEEKGVFLDRYEPSGRKILPPHDTWPTKSKGGRPLIDDSIFYKLYQKTGDQKFLDVHLKLSDTLVADQNPKGSWIDYAPNNPDAGRIHPRTSYWWALPLIDSYLHTGNEKYKQTAIDGGIFCQESLRMDGGWFRAYYTNKKTDSFGHATSGSACAAILWLSLYEIDPKQIWVECTEKALNFCLKVQFTNPDDLNLKGAILEKVMPPNGSDKCPYVIRDLGTIFFVIAACKYLDLRSKSLDKAEA